MSTLLDIRKMFVQRSGHYELVVDAENGDWSDNGADEYIRAGQRWLDRNCPSPVRDEIRQFTIAQGDYFKALPDLRYIKRVDVYRGDSDQNRRTMLNPQTLDWMRDNYPYPWSEVEQGLPRDWARVLGGIFPRQDSLVKVVSAEGQYGRISPDGTMYAVYHRIDLSKVYNAETNEFILALPYTLWYFSDDSKAIIWQAGGEIFGATDIETGEEIVRFDPGNVSHQVIFRDLTKALVMRDRSLELWDLTTDEPELIATRDYTGVESYEPHEIGGVPVMRLATTIEILDLNTLDLIHTLPGFLSRFSYSNGRLVTWSADEKLLRCYTKHGLLLGSRSTEATFLITSYPTEDNKVVLQEDNYIRVWNLETDEIDYEYEQTDRPIWIITGPKRSGHIIAVKNAQEVAIFNLVSEPAIDADLLFLPPADASYLMEVIGGAYAYEMRLDDDVSWWSDRHPEILVRAARLQLEIDRHRNSTGVEDFAKMLTADVQSIYHDIVAEKTAGPSSRFRSGVPTL